MRSASFRYPSSFRSRPPNKAHLEQERLLQLAPMLFAQSHFSHFSHFSHSSHRFFQPSIKRGFKPSCRQNRQSRGAKSHRLLDQETAGGRASPRTAASNDPFIFFSPRSSDGAVQAPDGRAWSSASPGAAFCDSTATCEVLFRRSEMRPTVGLQRPTPREGRVQDAGYIDASSREVQRVWRGLFCTSP